LERKKVMPEREESLRGKGTNLGLLQAVEEKQEGTTEVGIDFRKPKSKRDIDKIRPLITAFLPGGEKRTRPR